METAEVVIVGAGPIGIELGVALKAQGVNPVLLEAGQVGSTMAWWAPGTRFFSSPERIQISGVPLVTPNQDKATREEYIAYLRQVVGTFSLDVRTYTRVVAIERDADAFIVRTRRSLHGVGGPAELERAAQITANQTPEPHAGERAIRAQRVVLAVGNMHAPRMIGVEGESLPHVSHYLEDPHKYAGTRVLIVGGKNSAVEAAIRLYRVGAHVTMSYRGARLDRERVKYWLLPEIEWLIRKGRIGFLHCTEVVAIDQRAVTLEGLGAEQHPDCGSIDHADVHDRQLERGEEEFECVLEHGGIGGLEPGQRAELETDFALLLTGYVQDPTLFEAAGVELVGDERRPRHDLDSMETNVPGLYVAGTACGGSQRRTRVFIETSHVHVERIVRALTGANIDVGAAPVGLEES